MTAIATRTDPPAPASTADPFRVPSGTTTLFVLLIAAVLATSWTAYMFLFFSTPSQYGPWRDVLQGCLASEPTSGRPIADTDDFLRHTEAARRVAQCYAPAVLDQALWAAFGGVLLLAVAGIIYGVLPRWLIRHHRFRPLQPGGDLATWLPALSAEAGLRRPPTFLAAPRATTGGLAFGGIGRRYVALDAGLLARAADRPGFRAVVLHELAHLRNRDVTKTYLAIAVWWSFVAVTLAPMAVLTVHPRLLSTPLRWRAGDIEGQLRTGVALLVLTGVVYLAYKAVLREREIYADARAAGVDGSGGALRTAVRGLSRPRPPWWRAVQADHPHPDDRLRAIDDPAVLLRPRLWEPLGAGLVTAVIAVNLRFLLDAAMPTWPVVAWMLAGLVCAPGFALPLGVAAWRTAARAGTSPTPARALLLPPLAMAAGFLVGERLALINFAAADYWSIGVLGYGWFAVAAAVLVAGGVLLNAWTVAVARLAVAAPARDRRWPLPAVLTAGLVVAAPWLAVWFMVHETVLFRSARLGATPSPGDEIGWYAGLARLVELTYDPLIYLFNNPLTLPGLILLWLVPYAIGRAGRPDLRPAVVAGLVGAAAYVSAAVALSYAARANLPVDVRTSVDFIYAAASTYVVVAVLAQAGVAAALAAVLERHRAVLVPLAVFLTGVLTVAATELAVIPVARCAGVFGSTPRHCLPPFDPAFAGDLAHWILVKGALAAIPAALAGAALGGLYRRLRPPPAPATGMDPAQPAGHGVDLHHPAAIVDALAPVRAAVPVDGVRRRRLGRAGPTLVVALLLSAGIAATGLGLPQAHRLWVVYNRPAAAGAPAPPDPTSTPPAACLVGTWRETRHDTLQTVDGVGKVPFTSSGVIQRFRPDGTGTVEFVPGTVLTGTVNGKRWNLAVTGTVTFRYQAGDDRIRYSDVSTKATVRLTIDGVALPPRPFVSGSMSDDQYSCTGDTMRQTTATSAIDLTRLSHTG